MHAQASNMDVGSSQSELGVDGSDAGERGSMCSPSAVPSYGGQVRREGVHGRKSANFAGVSGSPFSERGGVFQNRVESSNRRWI